MLKKLRDTRVTVWESWWKTGKQSVCGEIVISLGKAGPRRGPSPTKKDDTSSRSKRTVEKMAEKDNLGGTHDPGGWFFGRKKHHCLAEDPSENWPPKKKVVLGAIE